jgi:hypothetical protein
MRIGKKVAALLAGGSAAGVGAMAAAVTSPDDTAPEPVDLGRGGNTADTQSPGNDDSANDTALDSAEQSADVEDANTGPDDGDDGVEAGDG